MIMHVVGARPNFMKAAPVLAACDAKGLPQLLLHTGQHYDDRMSEIFFKQLKMRKADINLEVGSASHAQQTANIMVRFEKAVLEHKPALVVVYGDVNSTLAAALVCSKLSIAFVHVEAGLRSGDRSMPEEINRLVVDQLADHLFTTCSDAESNLIKEGIAKERISFVGNVMIDTLVKLIPEARQSVILDTLNIGESAFILVTMHRPSNVDDTGKLAAFMSVLERISRKAVIVFPVHPRTRARIEALGSVIDKTRVKLVEPLGYIDFLRLQMSAKAVITDSGGVQEETTYLGVPCLTMRSNTERPITVTEGTNQLLGDDYSLLENKIGSILNGVKTTGQIPRLWDGHAAERIAERLVAL